MLCIRDIIWILAFLALTATVANAASSLCLNGTITASSGLMDDGTAAGQNYANRLFCERLIVAGPGQCIVVTITKLNTEVKFDVLTFYDGANTTSSVLASLSGSSLSLPYVIRSTKNALLVRFTSDDSVTADGFEFSWVFAAAALGAQWSLATANAPFGPVNSMPLVVFNNQLVLITSKTGAKVWSSADGGVQWRLLASNVFPRRWNPSSVVYDGRIWVICGLADGFLRDVLYSSNGVDWAMDPNPVPFTGRDAHSSVVYNNSIWTFGGWTANGFGVDVWNASVRVTGSGSLVWTMTTSNHGIAPRWGQGHVVHLNQMFVIGGQSQSNSAWIVLNDVWRSANGREWISVTPSAPFSGRCRIFVVVYVGRMWVIGGGNPWEATSKDVWSSPDGANWALESPDPPLGIRWTYRAVVHRSRLIVIGGINTSIAFADLWNTAALADVWAMQSTEASPSNSSLLVSSTTPTVSPTLTVTKSFSKSTSPSLSVPSTPTLFSTPTPSSSASVTPHTSPSPSPSQTAQSTNTPPGSASSSTTISATGSVESSISPSPSPSPTASHTTLETTSATVTQSQSPSSLDSPTLSRSETRSVTLTESRVPEHFMAVDCVGQWVAVSQCSVSCGLGTGQSVFEVRTPASHGGKQCEAAAGSIRTSTCELSACENVDCRGVFVTTSPCNAECDGGQLIETFLIVTKANGNGAPCEFATGYTRTQRCNTDACGFGFKSLVVFAQRHLWFAVACGFGLVLFIVATVSLTCCCCRKRHHEEAEHRPEARYRIDTVLDFATTAGPSNHPPPPPPPPLQPPHQRPQSPAPSPHPRRHQAPSPHNPCPLNPNFQPDPIYPNVYPNLADLLERNAELNDVENHQ